jgi:hypothetical protein
MDNVLEFKKGREALTCSQCLEKDVAAIYFEDRRGENPIRVYICHACLAKGVSLLFGFMDWAARNAMSNLWALEAQIDKACREVESEKV